MRNILITAMMLVVVIVLFVGVINGEKGIKKSIEEQGSNAAKQIENALLPSQE